MLITNVTEKNEYQKVVNDLISYGKCFKTDPPPGTAP